VIKVSDQDKNQLFSSASFWTRGEGQQNDVVVSSRIRLARNLKNHSFPHKMDSREARSVVKEIAGAIKKNGNYTLVEYDKMSPAELSILVEKHLVSPQHISTPEGRALLIRNDEAVAIMINEEDHLRIQTIFPAMQIKEAWRVANKVDDQLSATLEIAFQPEFGYLASCPTNLYQKSTVAFIPAAAYGLCFTGALRGGQRNYRQPLPNIQSKNLRDQGRRYFRQYDRCLYAFGRGGKNCTQAAYGKQFL